MSFKIVLKDVVDNELPSLFCVSFLCAPSLENITKGPKGMSKAKVWNPSVSNVWIIWYPIEAGLLFDFHWHNKRSHFP